MSKSTTIFVDHPLDRRILMYVQWQQSGSFGACCTTYQRMADMWGVCERTVRRHMAALRKKGLLFHRGYVSGKRGRLVVWNTLQKCRVVLVSFAERVRAMSAFCRRRSSTNGKCGSDGRLVAYITYLLDILPEDQHKFLHAAIRRWGVGSVLDALDQISDRYHADRAMRVVWAILAGRC